jgi:hypothetical protein
LPEITKNTVVKRREVDFSLLEEDPIFGDFRKNNIRKRLMVPDGNIGFSTLAPTSPAPRVAHSTVPRNMPSLVKVQT